MQQFNNKCRKISEKRSVIGIMCTESLCSEDANGIPHLSEFSGDKLGQSDNYIIVKKHVRKLNILC